MRKYWLLLVYFNVVACSSPTVSNKEDGGSQLSTEIHKESGGDDSLVSQPDDIPEPSKDSEDKEHLSEIVGKRSHEESKTPRHLGRLPNEVPDAYRKLVAAKRAKNDNTVIAESAKLLAEKGDDVETLNLVAMYHYQNKNYQLAKLILSRAFKNHPKSSALYANYGLVLMADGEEREGLGYLQKALELDSDNWAANATLGSYYVSYSGFQRAVTLLQKAYSMDSDDREVANNYAIALRGVGRFKDARDVYERILDRGSSADNTKTIFNYAVLLIDYMGKPQEGLKLVYKLSFIGSDQQMAEELKVLEKKAKEAVK